MDTGDSFPWRVIADEINDHFIVLSDGQQKWLSCDENSQQSFDRMILSGGETAGPLVVENQLDLCREVNPCCIKMTS
jgi:hypothetical protein